MSTYNFAEQSRDEIILGMKAANPDWSLNKAEKEYIKAKKAAGFKTGVVSRKDDAFKLMDKLELSETIDLKTVKEALVDELGVAEGTARDYIKAYADEHGLAVNSGAQSQPVMDWIVANAPSADASDEEWAEFDESFLEWGLAAGRSRNNLNEYRKGLRLHLALISR